MRLTVAKWSLVLVDTGVMSGWDGSASDYPHSRTLSAGMYWLVRACSSGWITGWDENTGLCISRF